MSHVYEVLMSEYAVTAFFFNPNIFPEQEYNKRLTELKRFSEMKNFDLFIENGFIKEWQSNILPLKDLGERSERCYACFLFRLEATFKKAKELDIGLVATTLSISPHKDTAMINRAGLVLSQKYGIEFYAANFKKNNGYKKSIELSRQYGFYRQDYCGCEYSKDERNK